jgi:hypothetical protein
LKIHIIKNILKLYFRQKFLEDGRVQTHRRLESEEEGATPVQPPESFPSPRALAADTLNQTQPIPSNFIEKISKSRKHTKNIKK